MTFPGKNIQRIIKKYSVDREVRRFIERREQIYDDEGLPVSLSQTVETVRIHDQPLTGKLIKFLPEGQRLEDVRRGWTVEVDKLKKQDQVNIDGFIFTVNQVQEYTSGIFRHKEFNLLRTGEQDNVWS